MRLATLRPSTTYGRQNSSVAKMSDRASPAGLAGVDEGDAPGDSHAKSAKPDNATAPKRITTIELPVSHNQVLPAGYRTGDTHPLINRRLRLDNTNKTGTNGRLNRRGFGHGEMARVVVPGAPHHVTQRGNRRQRTFFGAADNWPICRSPPRNSRRGASRSGPTA
jgi:hypothetical protein